MGIKPKKINGEARLIIVGNDGDKVFDSGEVDMLAIVQKQGKQHQVLQTGFSTLVSMFYTMFLASPEIFQAAYEAMEKTANKINEVKPAVKPILGADGLQVN